MRAVTEQEFNEWRGHPITQAIMEILAKKREDLRQAWEGGSFTDYDERAMALTNVGNIGICKGYAYVQELDYEQYTGEIDEQHVGVSPAGGSSAD
jgi:hypothetical protein